MKTFSEFNIKNLVLRNRVVLPPMCMYSSDNEGLVSPFQQSHYMSFATGGVGLIILEATGVQPNGRISSNDLGIWNDSQMNSLKQLVVQCQSLGSKVAIQLSHAGRKCRADVEYIVAPSSILHDSTYRLPKELTTKEIKDIVQSFRNASLRVNEAGFDAVELHGAHGYLIHQFLSPISNKRTDEYGGSLENRVRFLKEILISISEVWPKEKPIILRISASDHKDGGINLEESIKIINSIREFIDIVHVSSGGIETVPINLFPGYQVSFAEEIKKECNLPTVAVGLIKELDQVEELLSNERADLVALGRELLRNPNWVLNNAYRNKIDFKFPHQYERAYR